MTVEPVEKYSDDMTEPVRLVMRAMYIVRLVSSSPRYGKLWIASPTGKTTVELPFYQALRIMRREHWHLARVEPVKPKLTRWQHLRAAAGRRKKE